MTTDIDYGREFGIVYDSGVVHPAPGRRYYGDDRDMGISVFASFEARAEAIETLKSLGYRYFTTFKDVQGPGLSWAWRQGPRVRRSRLDRLPSVQRARSTERARQAFQGAIFHDPLYHNR